MIRASVSIVKVLLLGNSKAILVDSEHVVPAGASMGQDFVQRGEYCSACPETLYLVHLRLFQSEDNTLCIALVVTPCSLAAIVPSI